MKIGSKWRWAAAVLTVAAAVTALPALCSAAELVLQGKVVEESGLGLGGVDVHAYVDGFERASGISGGDGSYMLTLPYQEDGDQTIVVWWVPVLQDQVPELVILNESERAQDLGLWSPCIPRLELQPSLSHDVTIYQEEARFDALGKDDCLQALR